MSGDSRPGAGGTEVLGYKIWVQILALLSYAVTWLATQPLRTCVTKVWNNNLALWQVLS